MKKTKNIIAIIIMAISILVSTGCTDEAAARYIEPESVSIQLRWSHQFQFAGYYAAVEKGFYAEEGLDVTLREADPGMDRFTPVLTGTVRYGVGDAGILKLRTEGEPVVLLAQIFQHSPAILISRRDSGIFSPHELAGKTIMIPADPISSSAVRAMLLETLGSLDGLTIMPRSYDEELIHGKVDAVAGYLSNEPFQYRQKGLSVNIIDPRSYGIDFYGDNLFTTDDEIGKHPDRVKKMRRATLKGWEYALKNKEEIIDLILVRYNSTLDREKLRFEAKVIDQMILPDLIPIGDIQPGRYARIAEIFHHLGLSPSAEVPEGFLYHEMQASADLLTAKERAWLRAHPDIRFVFSDDFQPALIVHENGRMTGILKEMLDLLNQRLKTDFTIVADELPAIRNMVRNREVAGPLAMGPTVANRYQLLATSAFLTSFPVIYARQSMDDAIAGIEDLFGRTCVIVGGTPEIEELLKPYGDRIAITRTKTAVQALKLLYEGKIDYFAGLAQQNYLIHSNQLVGIRPILAMMDHTFHTVMGVRNDWPELVGILNKGLATISDDERNTILARWSNLPKPTRGSRVLLSRQEKEWLEKKKPVRVGISDLQPFVFINEGRPPSGITIDILSLIAERTGAEFSYDTVSHSLNNGGADKPGGAPELLPRVGTRPASGAPPRHSLTYMRIPQVVFTDGSALPVNGIRDLSGHILGVMKGSPIHRLISRDYTGIQLLLFESEQDALKAVHLGKAKFYIGALTIASRMISRNDWTNLKVAGPSGLEDLELFFEIPGGAPELLGIINKGLDSISEEERIAIRNRHMAIRYEYGISTVEAALWIALVIGASGGLLLLAFFWNRSLAARVREYTADLNIATKQKMALQSDLAHMNRIMTMSELSASLAHEINQPLGAILNNATSVKILHEGLPERSGKIEELLDNIAGDAYRAGQIIRRIRGVVKKGESNYEILDINALIDEAVELFQNTLNMDSIHLRMDKQPALPQVTGDRIRLQQVVMNLISNAVDAMRDSDPMILTIQSCLRLPEGVAVSVGDSGPGIPDEMKDRLFDPFFTTKKTGLGIGLRISRSIIEENGGRIWVEDNPDGGTIFRFTLKTDRGDIE